MTRSYGLISEGVIVNVAVTSDPPDAGWLAAVTDEFDYAIDLTDIAPRPAIGWLYDGTTFTAPPEPEPEPAP